MAVNTAPSFSADIEAYIADKTLPLARRTRRMRRSTVAGRSTGDLSIGATVGRSCRVFWAARGAAR